MPYYSITDINTDTTTTVYELPSCDFTSIFELLKQFSKDNGLRDSYICVRDYADDEKREHGQEPALLAYKEKLANNKKARKPKLKNVDSNQGTAHVISFDWVTHKIDNAKQIDYKFYDNGWPGSILVSKKPSLFTPTEIVIRCKNTENNLQEKFFDLVEQAEIKPSKI